MTDDAITDKLRPSDLPLTGCGSPLRCSPLFRRRTPLRRRRFVGGGCSVRLRLDVDLYVSSSCGRASGRLSGGTGAKPARSQGAAARASMATAPGRLAMLFASARRTFTGELERVSTLSLPGAASLALSLYESFLVILGIFPSGLRGLPTYSLRFTWS